MKLIRSHRLLFLSLLGFLVLATPTLAFADTGWFQALVYSMVVTVTGWLLGLGGMILNYGINDFLLGFGNTFGETGIGVAVNSTWTIIRDFVNMTFIFGLVYIGFKMILNSGDSQSKRWLANLVIAALLINFSLFITKGVIEVSNQFAAQILTSGFETDSDGKVDIASTLMSSLGISSIYNQSIEAAGVEGGSGLIGIDGNAWGYIFGTGFLFVISAFVFAAGGVLLIFRFAILNMYMILSPVLFLGWILPPLSGTLDKYWKEFLKKCFFAPIYILLLYFSFKVLDGMQQSNIYNWENMKWDRTTSGSGELIVSGTQSTIPFFILTCFFLIASLVVANKMGAEGAGKAMSMGKRVSNATGRFAQRQTLGRGAQGVGWAAKGTAKGYRRLDANVEKINNKWVKRGIRGAAAVSTLGLATEKNVSAALAKGQTLSVAGSESYTQLKDREKKVSLRQSQELKDKENKERFKTNTAVLENKGSTQALTLEQLKDSIYQVGKSIRDMTDEERADLGKDELTKQAVALHLSDQHIESLEKSGEFSHADIQSIKDSRKAAQKNIAGQTQEDKDKGIERGITEGEKSIVPNTTEGALVKQFSEHLRQELAKGSVQDIGKLPKEIFMSEEMSDHLTPQMVEQRMRNGDLTNKELDEIKKNIEKLVNVTKNGDEKTHRVWKKWENSNSVYSAQLNLKLNDLGPSSQSTPPSQPIQQSNTTIITPNSQNWNSSNQNLPPRPGPQP